MRNARNAEKIEEEEEANLAESTLAVNSIRIEGQAQTPTYKTSTPSTGMRQINQSLSMSSAAVQNSNPSMVMLPNTSMNQQPTSSAYFRPEFQSQL